jgi:hypothetical protein
MLLTTILTAPRPNGIEYLSQTQAALEQQQAAPMVFRDTDQKGNRKILQLILRWFVAREEYDRLLFLEDDIVPCQSLIPFVQAAVIRPSWPVLSLYDPRIADPRPQWLSMNVEAFFYTQALIFPRSTAEKIVELDWENRAAPLRNGNGASGGLRYCFKELGFREYGLQLPNLVQHIGKVSAILKRPTLAPQSPTFPGKNFNALSVFQTHSS